MKKESAERRKGINDIQEKLKSEEEKRAGKLIYLVHQKDLISTFNICFSTKHPLIILYLPIKNKIVILCTQNPVLNGGLTDF